MEEVVTVSDHNQILRMHVARNPTMFIQTGSENPAIRMGTPVISLARWSRATNPKIVPEKRNASFVDFIPGRIKFSSSDCLFSKIKPILPKHDTKGYNKHHPSHCEFCV